jgi:hypothetical protein
MGKLFEFLTERFFGDRATPRLNVSFEKLGASAEPDPTDPQGRSRITWKMKLLFENETDALAADLKLFWPGGKPPFEIRLPYYLDRFDNKAATFRLERTVPSGVAAPGESPEKLWELLPEEIRNLTIVVSYRSQRGEIFYTRFTRREGQGSSELLEALPTDFSSPSGQD